jgi:hypothetical protein
MEFLAEISLMIQIQLIKPVQKKQGLILDEFSHVNGSLLLFAVVFIDTKSDGLLAVPVGSMDSQEAISSLCASSGYDLRVNKIFKDDVNKERARKGFSKLDDAYFY